MEVGNSIVGRSDAGKHLYSASGDHIIMMATKKFQTPNLHDIQAAALIAKFRMHFLQVNHSMHNALYLKVLGSRREIIEHEHGALLRRKILLEGQHLAAVTQGRFR